MCPNTLGELTEGRSQLPLLIEGGASALLMDEDFLRSLEEEGTEDQLLEEDGSSTSAGLGSRQLSLSAGGGSHPSSRPSSAGSNASRGGRIITSTPLRTVDRATSTADLRYHGRGSSLDFEYSEEDDMEEDDDEEEDGEFFSDNLDGSAAGKPGFDIKGSSSSSMKGGGPGNERPASSTRERGKKSIAAARPRSGKRGSRSRVSKKRKSVVDVAMLQRVRLGGLLLSFVQIIR